MEINITEIKDFIATQSTESKIYIGVDSNRFASEDGWFADYTSVVVIHIDGKHGCKLFGETIREKDFDQKGDKPQLRLMNEVYKVAELYLKLADVFGDRQVEIHLDLNPDPSYISQSVVQQAIGYIRGVCNVSPQVKPFAFAASCAADRYRGVGQSLEAA
ncbi:MAG: hypothetical protein CBC42_06500 [Betaproteobacteria bacterium TMED82]|nr:MAG: hypothetical protein CBC42_06500 [Betaproteobacteria bacterium TMED82]|tara:strand:- start:2309 stop:2788 length:480 start_codon:yes stop_codon:yes gene_type:complete